MLSILPLLGISLFFLALSLSGTIEENMPLNTKNTIKKIILLLILVSVFTVFLGAISFLLWG